MELQGSARACVPNFAPFRLCQTGTDSERGPSPPSESSLQCSDPGFCSQGGGRAAKLTASCKRRGPAPAGRQGLGQAHVEARQEEPAEVTHLLVAGPGWLLPLRMLGWLSPPAPLSARPDDSGQLEQE